VTTNRKTQTHSATDADAATDANTLDAETLIEEARLTGMTPRSLTPYQQEELTTALAQLETFGRVGDNGALSPFIVLPISTLVSEYLLRIPAANRRPSNERAERDIRKSILADAFDESTRLARVALSTDPNDYNEKGWCVTAGTPELVWYEKDESSRAAQRGEKVWCFYYVPDTYEVPSTDPFAAPGETVTRSGMFNRYGLAGITKTYSSLQDAEDDAAATRRALATIRRLSDAVTDDDDDDDDEPQPKPGAYRASLT